MNSEEAFESIAVLKHKFEEVKNNIINTEKNKVKLMQSYSGLGSKFEHQRPASTSKLRDSIKRTYCSDPEHEKFSEMILMLNKQIRNLQEINDSQASTIENLTRENLQLKKNLEEKILAEKKLARPRPQSCLRSSSANQKKARVAFAKNLTEIKYIPRNGEFSESTAGINEVDENIKTVGHKSSRSQNYPLKEEFVTPLGVKNNDRSSKNYFEENRALLSRLSSVTFDTETPDFFREKCMNLAKMIIKD